MDKASSIQILKARRKSSSKRKNRSKGNFLFNFRICDPIIKRGMSSGSEDDEEEEFSDGGL